MRRAGYDVRERDPFITGQSLAGSSMVVPPIATRIHALRETLRDAVTTAFPQAPGRPCGTNATLATIDCVARDDAYQSLSIEGYRVRIADFQSLPTAEHRHRDRAECAADGRKPDPGNVSANDPVPGRWPKRRIRCTCCQSQPGRPRVAHIELAKLERETIWTRMPGCTPGPSQLFNRWEHVSDP